MPRAPPHPGPHRNIEKQHGRLADRQLKKQRRREVRHDPLPPPGPFGPPGLDALPGCVVRPGGFMFRHDEATT